MSGSDRAEAWPPDGSRTRTSTPTGMSSSSRWVPRSGSLTCIADSTGTLRIPAFARWGLRPLRGRSDGPPQCGKRPALYGGEGPAGKRQVVGRQCCQFLQTGHGMPDGPALTQRFYRRSLRDRNPRAKTALISVVPHSEERCAYQERREENVQSQLSQNHGKETNEVTTF